MKHDLVFGVFNNSKLILLVGRTRCSHVVAAIVVGILDLAKHSLKQGDYFACDYASNLNL